VSIKHRGEVEMSIEQITEKQAANNLKYETAKRLRQILDEAKGRRRKTRTNSSRKSSSF
jgi:hypothetical protein